MYILHLFTFSFSAIHIISKGRLNLFRATADILFSQQSGPFSKGPLLAVSVLCRKPFFILSHVYFSGNHEKKPKP